MPQFTVIAHFSCYMKGFSGKYYITQKFQDLNIFMESETLHENVKILRDNIFYFVHAV